MDLKSRGIFCYTSIMNQRKEALYRHYRPKKFKEVVGQDHILKALENKVQFLTRIFFMGAEVRARQVLLEFLPKNWELMRVTCMK
jgi:hypothetical protein